MNTERLPRTVWVLSTVGFCVAVGFGVAAPVLPVFARTFGVSAVAVGAVLSSFALVRLLATPFAPRLVAAVGERALITGGVAVVALTSLGTGLATSYPILLATRAAGGVGSAFFTLAATQLLLRSTPRRLLGRASSIFGGGFLLGSMAGPAVGGLLVTISMGAPFFFYAATLAVAALVALTMLPRHGVIEAAQKQQLPFTTALRDPRYRAAMGSMFAQGWQSLGARGLIVPLLVTETLAMAASWTGIAFAVAAAAQGLALYGAGWLTDHVGRKPVLVVGSLATAVLGVGLALSGSFTALVVLLCLYGVGASLSQTSQQATLGDALRDRGGSALAANQMAGDIGTILGPLVAGVLLDQFSPVVAMAGGAVLLLGSTALALALPPDDPPASAVR